jgi:hypothetical protein
MKVWGIFSLLFIHWISQVSSFARTGHALDDDGVVCWGDNSMGQLNVPSNLKNVSQISVGGGGTCVIEEEGVKCWGNSSTGQFNVPGWP